jgi:Xaa-Pro aminopeptidase
MMHGVNHYTGLDVHDVGGKDEAFVPGMVLTYEPAIYIREERLGIRLENNIVIGYPSVDLMAPIPLEPDEIEDVMSR